MGSDDLFKKRREARTQRKHEYKTTKANSYLIVTEGERTEPLYYKGMQKLIQEKVGGVVDIIVLRKEPSAFARLSSSNSSGILI
jgi:hypothetical protein